MQTLAQDAAASISGWRHPTSPTRYDFHGRLDEVAIFNRALLPSEIAAQFHAGTTSAPFGRSVERTFIVNVGTSSVAGTVWHDNDVNANRGLNEFPSEGSVVYVDDNDNGIRDGNERSAVTNSAGQYELNGLPPGTYRVRVEVHAAFVLTHPAGDEFQVATVGTNEIVSVDFGVVRVVDVGPVRPVKEGSTGAFRRDCLRSRSRHDINIYVSVGTATMHWFVVQR